MSIVGSSKYDGYVGRNPDLIEIYRKAGYSRTIEKQSKELGEKIYYSRRISKTASSLSCWNLEDNWYTGKGGWALPALLFQVESASGSRFERLTIGERFLRKDPPTDYQPLTILDGVVQGLNDFVQPFNDAILLVKYSLGSRFHRLQSLFA